MAFYLWLGVFQIDRHVYVINSNDVAADFETTTAALL